MRRISSILGIVMALLWVPLTAHCEVAELIGAKVEHSQDCSEHSERAPTGGCDHCSLCQAVEIGLVTSSALHLDFKPALLPVFDFSTSFVAELFQGTPAIAPSPPMADKLSPSSWQFLLRTALSPRAPSLVS